MKLEPVIGLEIHVELKTKTKMFCDSPNDPNETHPNVNLCPICMGHPGTLPTINREALKKVIQVGLALNGNISEFSQFDRKNYFYPDLPKGYQISQYPHPLVNGGWLDIMPAHGGRKKILIRRIHLEEDTARSLHDPTTKTTLIDFNRAGIPLMELVTEPELHSAEEARLFAENLRLILSYLDASNADMEKGEMRIEANVSLRPADSDQLGSKVELKNINSFRFVEQAISYEIHRQTDILKRGEKVVQETRGWDAAKEVTVSQRLKEESQDYRYFPEPDLPPLAIDPARIKEIKATLPELPGTKLQRFTREYDIDSQLAQTIIRDKNAAHFFEAVISELLEWRRARGDYAAPTLLTLAANYLTTDLAKLLGEHMTPFSESLVTPENFAELITYISEGKISSRAAKDVLREMFSTGADPSIIIEEKKLWQVSDATDLTYVVERIIDANSKAALDYRSGKTAALQFLVGQVMKELRGANPDVVRKILEEKLQ